MLWLGSNMSQWDRYMRKFKQSRCGDGRIEGQRWTTMKLILIYGHIYIYTYVCCKQRGSLWGSPLFIQPYFGRSAFVPHALTQLRFYSHPIIDIDSCWYREVRYDIKVRKASSVWVSPWAHGCFHWRTMLIQSVKHRQIVAWLHIVWTQW